METRFGSRFREVWDTEGSRNRDSTVFMSLNLLFRLSTQNGAIINKNLPTFWCWWFLQFFSSPSKESRMESVFITVSAWKHLHWLIGIAIFAPVGPLNSWELKVLNSLELNRIDFLRVSNRLWWCLETTSICIESTCIETTLHGNDRNPQIYDLSVCHRRQASALATKTGLEPKTSHTTVATGDKPYVE